MDSIPSRSEPSSATPSATTPQRKRRSDGPVAGDTGSQPPSSNVLLAPLAENRQNRQKRQRRLASPDETRVHFGNPRDVVPVESALPHRLSTIHDDAKLAIADAVRKSSVSGAIALYHASPRSWHDALSQRFEYELLKDARKAVVKSGPLDQIRIGWLPVLLPDELEKTISRVIKEDEQGSRTDDLRNLGEHMGLMNADQLDRFIYAATCTKERGEQAFVATKVIAGMSHLTQSQRWAMVRYVIVDIALDRPWLLGDLAEQMGRGHLSPGQCNELFAFVQRIENLRVRGILLAELGPGASYLSEAQCKAALEFMFNAGGDAPLLAAGFAAHGARLDLDQCEILVDICTSLRFEELIRAGALAELGTSWFRFSVEQRQRLLNSAASISDPTLRVKAMTGLAAGMKHLTERQRKMVLDAILGGENDTVDQWWLTEALIACIGQMEHLPADDQTRVVASVLADPALLPVPWPQMAHLNDQNLQSVVAATTAAIELGDPDKLEMIAPAVEYLNPTQRDWLIATIANIDDEYRKANVLRRFKPAMSHLRYEQRKCVRDIALAIADKRCKADALVGLAIGDAARA